MQNKAIWKVVPMCDRQKLDIRSEDILSDGDFRKCNTYRGGGGYDQFPYICEKWLQKRLSSQFVVQLFGCPLKCPYCYVTPSGIWGDYKEYSSDELIHAFIDSGQDVFHLMGGAPALYLENWPELISRIPEGKVFHSDFLLVEKEYKPEWLNSINIPNSLYAVSIKGVDSKEFRRNTGTDFNGRLFWDNLDVLVGIGLNFYLTFTNPNMRKLDSFKNILIKRYGIQILDDSFVIPLIQYKAIKKT